MFFHRPMLGRNVVIAGRAAASNCSIVAMSETDRIRPCIKYDRNSLVPFQKKNLARECTRPNRK